MVGMELVIQNLLVVFVMNNKNNIEKLTLISLIGEYGSKCALEMTYLMQNDEILYNNSANRKKYIMQEINEIIDNF